MYPDCVPPEVPNLLDDAQPELQLSVVKTVTNSVRRDHPQMFADVGSLAGQRAISACVTPDRASRGVQPNSKQVTDMSLTPPRTAVDDGAWQQLETVNITPSAECNADDWKPHEGARRFADRSTRLLAKLKLAWERIIVRHVRFFPGAYPARSSTLHIELWCARACWSRHSCHSTV